ncbi:MAG: NAD(P)H-hydrate epimerase [Spirosomaceae bacterium]|nr:NAD(P)H-hydrate epimerase [Spirosomataceae bacterium]
MKIFSTQQIREADAYTIANEPIASIDLMERASRAFANWFSERFSISESRIKIICGLGNNGGDGLAIARMLHPFGYDLEVFVVRYSDKTSTDFDINFARLSKQLPIQNIDNQDLVNFDKNDLVIDAIFGSGLSRPIEGLVKEIVTKLNLSDAKVVAVDIPTGLYADSPNNATDCIVEADFTVSFQLPKLAFMLPQNDKFVGKWSIVPIGLSQQFIENTETSFYYSDKANSLIKPRQKFSHKGTFGHGLLIAGSHGMMGAAVLALAKSRFNPPL